MALTHESLQCFDPGNHLGKDFWGDGFLYFFIFRERSGGAVLEEVVQSNLSFDEILATRRETRL